MSLISTHRVCVCVWVWVCVCTPLDAAGISSAPWHMMWTYLGVYSAECTCLHLHHYIIVTQRRQNHLRHARTHAHTHNHSHISTYMHTYIYTLVSGLTSVIIPGACMFTFGKFTMLNSQKCMYYLPMQLMHCQTHQSGDLKFSLHTQLDQGSNLGNVKPPGQESGGLRI